MADDGPESTLRRFAESLHDGDLDAIVGLYAADAAFAPQPGRCVIGETAIREALGRFLALRPRMTGEIEKVLVAGDTALVANRWSLQGTGPEGEAIEMRGTSADVLRRQDDGSWRIAIDDPWGAGG